MMLLLSRSLSKIFPNNYQETNNESSKPLPSFKTVHNPQREINDDAPPPTPGFNIMDILEEEPLLPSTNDPNEPGCSFDTTNNINNQVHNNMNRNLNEQAEPQNSQQMNGQMSQNQAQQGLPNIHQNIQGQSQHNSTQNFSNQLTAQQVSQISDPMLRPTGGVQQANQQIVNPMNQMGQPNLNQWSGGQMDPATMAYWYNANGGNGGATAGNMPYWWNGGGGGSGGGGMPPPIL